LISFKERIRQLVIIWLLRGLKQPWSYQLMHAFNRVLPMIGVEAVIFRYNKGVLEILLTRRDKDDPNWPGMWHVSGTTQRNDDVKYHADTDANFYVALERIWKSELKLSDEEIGLIRAEKCDIISWRHSRGACVSTIFACWFDKVINFSEGEFFPVDALPEDFLEGQQVVVSAAVRYVKQQCNAKNA